jgi:hypothetical protein
MEKYVGLDVSMEETSACASSMLVGTLFSRARHPRNRTRCRNFLAQRHPTLRASYLKPAH